MDGRQYVAGGLPRTPINHAGYPVDDYREKQTDDPEQESILYRFAQEASWHGLKQISEERKFTFRKLVWILVTLLAFGVFVYAIVAKLQEFYRYESQIEITTTYPAKLPFPRVTICNLNPIRMTALQNTGKFDAVTQAYQQVGEIEDKVSHECEEYFELKGAACGGTSRGNFTSFVKETTFEVCSYLCKTIESQNCSGIFFDYKKRECTLTSYTGEVDGGLEDCTNSSIRYYRRHRCVSIPSIDCDFESDFNDENCALYEDSGAKDKFTITTGVDHTFNRPEGNYLNLQATNLRGGFNAIMQTDYLNTTGSCLMVSYYVHSTVELAIYLRDEELQKVYMFDEYLHADGSSSPEWSTMFIPDLAGGINQVVIEANRTAYGSLSGIGLDDLRILPCETFLKQSCLKTAFGEDYLGTKNTSQSGASCQRWVDSTQYMSYESDFVQGIDEASSFCRNPTKDPFGPWCFINAYGQKETCGIPRCACPNEWFGCKDNGLCIPPEWKCNGNRDCDDGSDELVPCTSKISINCGFEDDFLCGYTAIGTLGAEWLRNKYLESASTADQFSLGFSMKGPMYGDIGYVISPIHRFSHNTYLSFLLNYNIDANDHGTKIEVFAAREDGSFSDPFMTFNHNDRTTYGWFYGYSLCFPPGNYGIGFRVTLGDVQTFELSINNVQMDTSWTCYSPIDPGQSENAVSTFSCNFDGDDVNCPYASRSTNIEFSWSSMEKSTLLRSDLTALSSESCDVDIYSLEGEIESIGYPAAYPTNIGCSYVFHLPAGSTLQLVIQEFNLEDSSSCIYDYLQISFGGSVQQRLCGSIAEGTAYSFTADEITFYFYSDYSWVASGFSISYSVATTGSSTDNAYALSYQGSDTYGYLVNFLEFGPLRIDSTVCFQFELLQKTSLVIAQSSSTKINTDRVVLFKNEDNSLGNSWQKFSFEINPLSNSNISFISFDCILDDPQNIFTHGVDAINMTEGACPVSAVVADSFSCSFDNSDQCGYQDISTKASKWARQENDGDYSMATFMDQTAKKQAILRSPLVEVSEDSCVYVSFEVEEFDSVLIVSKMASDQTTKDAQLVTSLSIIDLNENEYFQLSLQPGTYYLLFSVGSGKSFIKITDIDQQPASPEDCITSGATDGITDFSDYYYGSGDEDDDYTSDGSGSSYGTGSGSNSYGTGSGTGSYGTGYGSSSYGTRSSGYDSNYENEDFHEEHIEVIKSRKLASKEIFDDLMEMQGGESVIDMKAQVAHTLPNTLLRCLYDGEDCTGDFEYIETDMGICYIFNGNLSNIISSTRSGSKKGLRLTLNIEAYENVDGLSDDAGIKVLLDYQDDTQQMQDKAFGGRPGTHSLVAMHYATGKYLTPKHGSCGVVPWKYFDESVKYTYARCMRECEITNLIKLCGCVDTYMNDGLAIEEECDLEAYLECALRVYADGDELSNCTHCLSACQSTVYTFGLSSVSLAAAAFSSLNDDTRSVIQRNYMNAQSLQQRVKSTNLRNILGRIQDLADQLSEYELEAKFYFLDPTTSLMATTEAVTKAFEDLLKNDTEVVYQDVPSFQEAYYSYLGGYIHSISETSDHVYRHYSRGFALIEVLKEAVVDESYVESEWDFLWDNFALPILREFQNGFREQINLDKMINVDILKQLVEIRTPAAFETSRTDSEMLPKFLASPRPLVIECQNFIEKNLTQYLYAPMALFGHVLNGTYSLLPEDSLQDVDEVDMSTFEDFENATSLLYDSRDEMRDTLYSISYFSTMISKCVSPYQTSLDTFSKRISEISFSQVTLKSLLKESEELADIRNAQRQLRDLKNAFTANKITVFDLSAEFEEVKDIIEEARTSLYSRIEQNLISVFHSTLTDIEKEIISFYAQGIEDTILMSTFMPGKSSDFSARIKVEKIWREPLPDVNGGSVITFSLDEESGESVVGRAVDVFWNNAGGKTKLQNNVANFFNTLTDAVTTEQTQLSTISTAIASAVSSLSELLSDYKEDDELIGSEFAEKNLLTVDIYFKDMSYQNIEQKKSYTLLSFWSDFGGYMGLMLGASAVSLVELLDWIFYHWLVEEKNCCKTKPLDEKEKEKKRKEESKQQQMYYGNTPASTDKSRGYADHRNGKNPPRQQHYVNRAYNDNNVTHIRSSPNQMRMDRINGSMRPHAYEATYGHWPR